jgi:hypothetical protein
LKAQGKEEEAVEKFQKAAEIDNATQDLPKSEHT